MRGTAFAVGLVLALAGAPPPVAPQAAGSGDSTRTHYRDRLVALRDTLQPVSAAIATFRRDLGSAGDETILSKAERLVRACGSARAALLDAVSEFAPGRVPPSTHQAADSLRASLRTLASGLDEHCATGLDPRGPGVPADSLRAWGPYRTAQLRVALDRFRSKADRFAAAARLRMPPIER